MKTRFPFPSKSSRGYVPLKRLRTRFFKDPLVTSEKLVLEINPYTPHFHYYVDLTSLSPLTKQIKILLSSTEKTNKKVSPYELFPSPFSTVDHFPVFPCSLFILPVVSRRGVGLRQRRLQHVPIVNKIHCS